MPTFLDVNRLLDSSRPVRQINWSWAAVGVILLLSVLGNLGASKDNSKDAAEARGVQAITTVLIVGALAVQAYLSIRRVRSLQAQQQTVDAIEEMVQLRRWESAGMLLDRFLSEPVKSIRTWALSLVQLSILLARHHRFEDAITVQEFLIDNQLLDDQGDYYIRMSRAMSMLREDHLVDADRAISDLRRRGPEAGSGGLALIEMFRDVKTGHPQEAIDIFAKHLPKMRQQLSNRVADAHALAARAYDMLGRADEARAAYERATLLAPVIELERRYPEVAKLAEKYPAAPTPPTPLPPLEAR